MSLINIVVASAIPAHPHTRQLRMLHRRGRLKEPFSFPAMPHRIYDVSQIYSHSSEKDVNCTVLLRPHVHVTRNAGVKMNLGAKM
jgi:hypothetical protein